MHRSVVVGLLGARHEDVTKVSTNLALLRQAQGHYAEAEPLYKRALAIEVKVLGPEHPEVATSLNNLAALYGLQSGYSEAEPLLRRALAIWEEALGPDYPTRSHVRESVLSANSLAKKMDQRCASVVARI